MDAAFGLSIPRTLEDICKPGEMALLVYDMQVGVVRQVKNGADLVERVGSALEIARSSGMRVVFTRHLSLPRELMGSFQYRMAMTWQHREKASEVEPWFLRDSPGFQIVPELTPNSREAIFDKITMSAFEGTPLSMVLRDCGIRAIAIAGLAIEVGIEPTARHAADLGIIPVLLSDACGSGREDAARRSFDSLKFGGDTMFADLSTFRTLLAPKP